MHFRSKKRPILLLIVFLLAFGCGNAEKGSEGGGDTGSIALSVNWQGAPTNPANNMAAAIDCAASSVATVSAYIYNSSNTLLSSGGPWSCSAHSATISNVPAGTGRRMFIVGSDSSGVVRYCGEQTSITVSSGQTTSVAITAYDFTPPGVSAAGGNGQTTIIWTAVTGATSYNIYWSTTTGVTKTTGTKITGVTSPHTQAGLTNGMAYYYVVTAVNSYGESRESAQVSATPTLATGTWTVTGSMTTGRSFHTATLLPNGKVLVAGGANTVWLSSAELYDPTTGLWTATGSMTMGMGSHTATPLPNGKVLVAGGNGLAELYDPTTGLWTATGTMTTARGSHTATLLPNGKVLVSGGYGVSSQLSSAELYDPTTGLWTATGTMTTARNTHTATLLPNGKVLVAGGYNGASVLSAELYTP